MEQIIVRFAVPEDLPFMQQIGNVHLADPLFQRKSNWQEVIMATIDKRYAGYLLIDYLWSTVPFISTIWVPEPHRKRGVGKTMLCFLEAALLDHGHDAVFSSSQLDEPPSQAWHRHVGFEECGIITGVNRGVGEVFFRKWLDRRN